MLSTLPAHKLASKPRPCSGHTLKLLVNSFRKHTMVETITLVLQLIRDELGADAAEPSLDAPLTEIGDSLAWVSLLCAVESQFDICIEPEQGLALRTVRDLITLLDEHRVAKT